MDKPSVLYRGVKIDYASLQNFKFSGVDLIVNYDPLIDKYGRKTVTDGNEYGVYMSDDLSMVSSVYGNIHNDGTPLYNNITIDYRRIMIPSVAIIYEINTEGLEIRPPFISDYLKGHYNNGFQGNEWIADVVPANNYKLYRVRIGDDILHEAEDIDLSKVENVSEEVKRRIEIRKYRLETFANAMLKIPSIKRNAFGRDELMILKSIYGKNGIKYINEDSLITTNIDGMLKYLISKVFKQNELNIDFKTIKYINSLRDRVLDIDSLIAILNDDKSKNLQAKVEFEERKKKEGLAYKTGKFDNQEKILNTLISLVIERKKKDGLGVEEELQVNNANRTQEDQEWEMIKEKYDYDNLEPEKQLVIEQEYRDILYKRRMNALGIDEDLFDEYLEKISDAAKQIEKPNKIM